MTPFARARTGLGFVADRLLGDPARWHPVAGFGRTAAALERVTYADRAARRGRPRVRRSSVARPLLGSRTPGGASRPGRCWAVARSTVRPPRSSGCWTAGDLPAARQRLTHLVGRDTTRPRRGRHRPGGDRVGRREHLRRRRRPARVGRSARHARAARLPRRQHARRDGRSPQPALRAVRLGGGPARRPAQPARLPAHRRARGAARRRPPRGVGDLATRRTRPPEPQRRAGRGGVRRRARGAARRRERLRRSASRTGTCSATAVLRTPTTSPAHVGWRAGSDWARWSRSHPSRCGLDVADGLDPGRRRRTTYDDHRDAQRRRGLHLRPGVRRRRSPW